MLRSLFSGITGLRAHQQMMDVTGNNIANVNSSGYKSQTAVFESVISQSVKTPGAPVAAGDNAAARGGVNGVQIGLGVQLAGVSTNFGQGSSQLTGVSTDFAIQGPVFSPPIMEPKTCSPGRVPSPSMATAGWSHLTAALFRVTWPTPLVLSIPMPPQKMSPCRWPSYYRL